MAEMCAVYWLEYNLSEGIKEKPVMVVDVLLPLHIVH
jgi:hypothetical protein